jgi:hypothetical protein
MVRRLHLCHYQAIGMETHHGSRWPTLLGKYSREFATSIMTSFTLVGNCAGSPERIIRPSPAIGHDAEILEV